MGVVFVLACRIISTSESTDSNGFWLVLFIMLGLVMRLSQLTSTPIYEKDFLRYLWDGAVTSSGISPYRASPSTIYNNRLLCSLRRGPAPTAGEPDDCTLTDLAEQSQGLVDRISYPNVKTIYPPLTQLAFAAAFRIDPFSLEAWRGLLLFAELLSIGAILGLLVAYRHNPLWAIVYWWNPVLIIHIANGAHVEALLTPALILALWAIASQRVYLAGLALALGAAIKIWPILLLPSLLAATPDRWRNFRAAGVGATVSILLLGPQIIEIDASAGLILFTTDWVRNAFAFPLLKQSLDLFLPLTIDADLVTRFGVAVALATIGLWIGTLGPASVPIWARRWALCIASLFLLVPTSYPWYFATLFPFLAFWRTFPLVFLPVTLPGYFLLYLTEPSPHGDILSNLVITAEFLPIWGGLAWCGWRYVRNKSGYKSFPAPPRHRTSPDREGNPFS